MIIPIINIYVNPVWIFLFVEIVGLIVLLAYHSKKRDMPSVFGVILDLIGIAATIYQMFPNDIPDTYIPQASPIEYHGSVFNEGWYYGGWRDGMPQGFGHLDYDFFSDGDYYSICEEGQVYRAVYYEGEFDKGYRYGEGIVVYEGGYKDEGTFFGAWGEGKKVFEGKRWLVNDAFNGYKEIEVWATSTRTADDRIIREWINLDDD